MGALQDCKQHPAHIYMTPGEYDVALEVGDATGSDENIEKKKYVLVN